MELSKEPTRTQELLVVIMTALVGSSTFGEPDAVKAARPVRRGAVGNVRLEDTQIADLKAITIDNGQSIGPERVPNDESRR
jgi:hypothetical protein